MKKLNKCILRQRFTNDVYASARQNVQYFTRDQDRIKACDANETHILFVSMMRQQNGRRTGGAVGIVHWFPPPRS